MSCGLYYKIEGEEKSIPLQNVVVEANIVDMITEVTVKQTYKNIEKDPIEAQYKFPIHEAAAVCGFEAEIDNERTVKGVVKESKVAAEEYTEAIEKGHGAYLLESESADIFQCSVGNLVSGQTVVIKITYVSELKHDSETEKIRFVLPTHIAPRYGFSSSPSNDGKILNSDAVTYSNKVDYYLDLTVTCRMTSAIQSVESPSHQISTEMYIDENPKISKITLAEQTTYLVKDFILVIKSKDLDQPRAFVEYNPETQTNCVMLTLVPKFALNATVSELIFVVDRSGSMNVEPMKKAAQALELLLRSIPENCYFNVVSFGSDHDSLFPKSQLYSEKTFSKALNLAKAMTSNYGGTEIFSALKWAFENSKSDMQTSVFLITDGAVWNTDQVVELVRENEERKKGDLRLFSLGIGCSVSHHLVESVARTGKGYAQFVTNNERMDKKVIGMLKNALKPPIKDYNISWVDDNVLESIEKPSEVPKVIQDRSTISDNTEPSSPNNIFTDIKIQQVPYFIPPIYLGVRFIVYCILEKNIEPSKIITLKATSQDGPIKLDIPLDPVILQGSKIHKLAARKLIQDLDDETSFLHNHPKNFGKHIPESLIKGQIVKLGSTFNLASKYTSFIGIDKRTSELDEIIIKAQKREVPLDELLYSRQLYNLSFGSNSHANSETLSQQISEPKINHKESNLASKYTSFIEIDKKTSKLDGIIIKAQKRKIPLDEPLLSRQLYNLSFGSNSHANSATLSQQISEPKINHKESKIENLLEFLGLQSYNGKFLPNKPFYNFFYKNDLNDLKNQIEKEVGKIKEIEGILCTCISMNYLEIIMFENFKDECEMCYEKAKKIFNEMVKDEEKRRIIFEKSKEWVQNWIKVDE